jgi:hypothetical protein
MSAGDHFTRVIGHLKPGVTPAAAASDLNIIAASKIANRGFRL